MPILDLSHTLSPQTPFFADQLAPRTTVVETAGSAHPSGRRSLNVSRFETNVHCGTHIDAPFHFFNDGKTIDQVALDSCVGSAVLIDLHDLPARAEIDPEQFRSSENLLREVKRGVIRTGWSSQWGDPSYFTQYPVISGSAADYLVSLGVLLVGIDTPSVDDSPFPAHLSLLGNGVLIVENLTNLDLVASGIFHLTVAPLKIIGRDGSPVRAFAQRFP